jgi:3-dehydroquinate synthetase
VLAASGVRFGNGFEVGGDAVVADAGLAAIHSSLDGAHLVSAKSLTEAERLWSTLALERSSTLVAVGGGTTTDLVGFVAATYMRGIDWIAVPSTLVGQVDAAIGGKTGIDLAGKNLVGAFHWPAETVIDVSLLDTLPAVELRNGLAEVVKTGLLAGEPLWDLDRPELIRRCAAYKAAVCLRDPRERGDRAQLNLGHTFAHALETASGYTISHGHAVSLGLLAALRLSGLEDEARTVDAVLAPAQVAVDRDVAWEALQRDKKVRDGRVNLVLLDAPGAPRITDELEPGRVRAALDALIA